MKPPWEQHASAAGLPRYSYHVLPSAHTLKGFLITCTLDREKSATKEAIEILSKHFACPDLFKCRGATELDDARKRVRLPCLENGHPHQDCKQEEKSTHSTESVCQECEDYRESDNLSIVQSHPDQSDETYIQNNTVNLKRSRTEFESCKSEDKSGIFLFKMMQKGVISIFWEESRSDDPVIILTQVLADILIGSSSPPRWCQRMLPIQATCVYSRERLAALVTELVLKYLGKSLPTETQPLKYAVSFNRRGFEAKEAERAKAPETEVPDKMTCIHVVAAAVSSVALHTVVDLKTPEMVVILEFVPFAGPVTSPICGVAVLSGSLMTTKPRLSVKSLITAAHQEKR
ncbi:hypothetical protein KP509_10G088500 [Ceratopteris richardii]|uniref:THUMP domain-containing protein n=1 Tax=Ceratopteris richardii TaxID=49495 RepID=A0A8T2TXX3_CERRI|nr:hypothetical protein KP509_10G088500 [Ceratopteris richardii]